MKFSAKISKLFLLLTVYSLLFTFSSFAQEGTYPQLDISGYKKWEYKKEEVTPKKNYFSGLTQLGGFYPNATGGPWQERLQLRILGQLSKDLSVTYDLEQQPETPDRFDIKVKYSDTEITFGDFTANFTGNEFASTSKFLNGVMVTSKDSWYDVIVIPSAKLKSQTQSLTSQKGTNSKGPYNLGHGSIVEGSEKIELNGITLVRNIDYTIDYFEGKITFNTILTSLDEFKYAYEYTNVLDLFFPSLSKRDFIGFQSRLIIDPDKFGQAKQEDELLVAAAREVFPAEEELDPDIAEKQSLGTFTLQHAPAVKFSETVTFRGTRLRKDEEYIFNYDLGEVKLVTRFIPSLEDPLIIEYRYYTTSAESETLPGVGSRGPYQLAHENIISESERIEVDGKLKIRQLDYTINYNTGTIIFGVILGPTSQIKTEYKYNVMAPQTISTSKFPKELKIGTTYLKESAKQSTGAASTTYIESITGQTIIDNNYTIYLQNRPVVPTTEAGTSFIVKLDNNELTSEVDYIIPQTSIDPGTGNVIVTPETTLAYINDRTDPSNGYNTGTIKIISPGKITPDSKVTVTYSYYKSILGKYSGVGENNSGPYSLRNVRNIVPGSEIVQVWDQGSSVTTTYTRNSSFEADAGDNGYFINYDADNPTITFNNILSETKNFQIIYQYKPPEALIGDDLSQSIYGFDGSFSIGEIFEIETAYAKSETDQVFVAESTTESIDADGRKTYPLQSTKNIIEGSEKVYVNNNLLNKDIDYYFNYTAPGQITFYYITPTTQDAVAVDYQFQSLSGLVVGQEKKTDSAYSVSGKTKLFEEALTIGGSTKKVGFDFTPMGTTAIGLGVHQKEYCVNLKPDWHDLSSSFTYRENNSPAGVERDRFIKSYDNNFTLGINPRNISKININYRNYQTLDDKSTTATAHNHDTRQESLSLGLVPNTISKGLVSLTQKYDLKKTISQNDNKRDSGTFSDTVIEYQHLNAGLNITKNAAMSFDYQKSEPKTISQKSTTDETEALSSHSRSTDTSYNLNLDLTDLTKGRFEKWLTRVSLLNHYGETLTRNFSSTNEAQTTKNETYHMDLIPFQVLTTAFDHNRQERSSFVAGGSNPKSERTTSNIRYTPTAWFSSGWKWAQSESIPETGWTKRTTGISNSYDTSWSPISRNRFKLTSKFILTDNTQTAPSGTIEGIETKTNTFAHSYNATITLHPSAPVNLGLAFESYKNINNHTIPDNQIDTETANKTITAGIALTPTPPINITSDYSIKTTDVIKDKVPAIQGKSLTKSIWDNKILVQVFSWGNFAVNQQNENNKGEVQGGTVASLDIEKMSRTYSVNINFPIDNPVLSSFILTASLKSVDYKNNNNHNDDFVASLLSLEGSMNF
ncbi:MAG: hypothetical protein ABIH69_01665 [bacterium]